MNMSLKAKQLSIVCGLWFALSSGFWVFLDPLGGMTVLQRAASNKWYVYSTVLVLTLFLAVAAYSFSPLRKRIANSDPLLLDVSRSNYDYLSLLSPSKTQIYLLGLSLPTFSLESKLEFLRRKVRDGVQVRIMLMNPFSPAILHRPERLYEISTGIAEACTTTMSVLIKLRKGMTENEQAKLEIGLINVHPSIGIIGNESQIFWSPYLATHTGARSPFLIHNLKESDFANEIMSHFDTLWQQDALKICNTTSVDDLKAFAERHGLAPVDLSQHIIMKLSVMFSKEA